MVESLEQDVEEKTEENTNVQETGTNGSICKTGVRRGEV